MNLHIWAPAFTGFGGGITVFSRELALGLKEQDHDVRLLGKHDYPGSWPGFQLWGAGHYTTPMQTPRFALGGIAAVARKRPDHVLSTHVNFGPAARVVKRLFGVSYSLVAHGIDIHSGLPKRTISALRDADRIFAVSNWTRRRLEEIEGIDPSRISILPNTMDESRFSVAPYPKGLAQRYGINADEKVILSVARLDASERYKGYDRLVRAIPSLEKRVGPVRFLLVGEGEDKVRVDALSKVLGVEKSITLAGFVPDEELADHYRLADVFAMPSTGEGFGIVFLEAMSCGTPVVAGNRDGSVDALQNGRLGVLVDPESIDAIVDGIASILGGNGESWWFDRNSLHRCVVASFGRDKFRAKLREYFPAA